MRKSIALTATQVAQADAMRPSLVDAIDYTARVYYEKADGEVTFLAGRIEDVKGTGDKEVVVVSTEKGFRSAHVYRVTNVRTW